MSEGPTGLSFKAVWNCKSLGRDFPSSWPGARDCIRIQEYHGPFLPPPHLARKYPWNTLSATCFWDLWGAPRTSTLPATDEAEKAVLGACEKGRAAGAEWRRTSAAPGKRWPWAAREVMRLRVLRWEPSEYWEAASRRERQRKGCPHAGMLSLPWGRALKGPRNEKHQPAH